MNSTIYVLQVEIDIFRLFSPSFQISLKQFIRSLGAFRKLNPKHHFFDKIILLILFLAFLNQCKFCVHNIKYMYHICIIYICVYILCFIYFTGTELLAYFLLNSIFKCKISSFKSLQNIQRIIISSEIQDYIQRH